MAEVGAGLPDEFADPADVGGHEYEGQVGHALAGNEEQLLTEVTAALDRPAARKFGRCEGRGRPIGHRRLGVIPYARSCIVRASREAAPG